MAQRKSGYLRQADERYETREPFVVAALAEHVDLRGLMLLEPCAASGLMARQLESHGATVLETDLIPSLTPTMASRQTGYDFRTYEPPSGLDGIATNPPWGEGGRLAVQFLERGLELLRRTPGLRFTAFLLSADFDSASGRTHLFADCPEFALKVVLLRRIRWFDGPSGPSTNHAWYVHFRRSTSVPHAPALRYAPKPAVGALEDL